METNDGGEEASTIGSQKLENVTSDVPSLVDSPDPSVVRILSFNSESLPSPKRAQTPDLPGISRTLTPSLTEKALIEAFGSASFQHSTSVTQGASPAQSFRSISSASIPFSSVSSSYRSLSSLRQSSIISFANSSILSGASPPPSPPNSPGRYDRTDSVPEHPSPTSRASTSSSMPMLVTPTSTPTSNGQCCDSLPLFMIASSTTVANTSATDSPAVLLRNLGASSPTTASSSLPAINTSSSSDSPRTSISCSYPILSSSSSKSMSPSASACNASAPNCSASFSFSEIASSNPVSTLKSATHSRKPFRAMCRNYEQARLFARDQNMNEREFLQHATKNLSGPVFIEVHNLWLSDVDRASMYQCDSFEVALALLKSGYNPTIPKEANYREAIRRKFGFPLKNANVVFETDQFKPSTPPKTRKTSLSKLLDASQDLEPGVVLGCKSPRSGGGMPQSRPVLPAPKTPKKGLGSIEEVVEVAESPQTRSRPLISEGSRELTRSFPSVVMEHSRSEPSTSTSESSEGGRAQSPAEPEQTLITRLKAGIPWRRKSNEGSPSKPPRPKTNDGSPLKSRSSVPSQ